MMQRLQNAKILTFDLDDTLWDNVPVIREAIEQSVAYLSHKVDIEPLSETELSTAKSRCIERHPALIYHLTELRERAYTEALTARNIEAPMAVRIAQEATELFMTLRSQVEPFEDADPVLEALRSHFRLGAITNGNCRFETIAISRHFEFCVTPLEAQAAKPNPEIYHYAATQYRYRPCDAVHIGDCLTNDIYGANQAGCQTIWFQPSPTLQCNHDANWRISSLTDLLQLIKND